MTVVYYVNTYFLDAALGTIRALKDHVNLHLLIELSPESKTTNIIDVDELKELRSNEDAEKVLGSKKWSLLKKELDGIKQVRFIVFKHRRCFSGASFKVAVAAARFIKKLRPDVIHFDSISPRILFLYFFLPKIKLFVTVHDPLPHSGEGSWKIEMCEKLYFKKAKALFFYSEFASQQFRQHHINSSVRLNTLKFQPFSYLQALREQKTKGDNTILFFGRIVLYKGVDLLLDAIPVVLEKFPDQQFVIAGKPFKTELNKNVLKKLRDNVSVLQQYINTQELTALICDSKFIVCPYRDATQSGVLMTAYGLGKMVVGTNVGAFPEYIRHNYNGLITSPDSTSIADAIIQALTENRYKILASKLETNYCEAIGKKNRSTLLNAYLL